MDGSHPGVALGLELLGEAPGSPEGQASGAAAPVRPGPGPTEGSRGALLRGLPLRSRHSPTSVPRSCPPPSSEPSDAHCAPPGLAAAAPLCPAPSALAREAIPGNQTAERVWEVRGGPSQATISRGFCKAEFPWEHVRVPREPHLHSRQRGSLARGGCSARTATAFRPPASLTRNQVTGRSAPFLLRIERPRSTLRVPLGFPGWIFTSFNRFPGRALSQEGADGGRLSVPPGCPRMSLVHLRPGPPQSRIQTPGVGGLAGGTETPSFPGLPDLPW